MNILDWAVVAGLLVLVTAVVFNSNRYTKSVADFLVAGRTVGRNMMALAEGSVWIGAVNIIAMFEIYYNGGFSSLWWSILFEAVWVFMALTGWLVYRYRQTRALTVAQFLDMRYSKSVRITAAALAWTAGIINFGIFPAVAGRFFLYFCGLPEHISISGLMVPTFPLIMITLIAISLVFVFTGGQISIIIANSFQGAFTNIGAIIILVYIFCAKFDWVQIVEALKSAPAEASMLHPFHSSGVKDFDVWYYVIAIIGAWYCQLSFLGSQACNASAKSAHDYRMSRALGHLRWVALCLFFLVLVIVSYTYLNHSAYVKDAVAIDNVLDTISPDVTDAVRHQQTITVALTRILPHGFLGLMAAIMLAAVLSTYDTFLHTWGSVFMQDIVIPLRKKPFTTKQHMRLLKGAIGGVAVFIFFFSWLYPQRQSILMYFALVNNIWLGGSGAIMIGGLYWKRGTTTAAMSALLLGAAMSVTGIVLVQLWPGLKGCEFPVNGQWIFFLTIVISSILYIVVSLYGSRSKEFNLDKLLHRGSYAVEENGHTTHKNTTLVMKLFGITREFSRFDRFTAYVVMGWFWLLFLIFIFGSIFGFIVETSTDSWATFWYWYMVQMFAVLVVSTIWLTCGGVRDVKKMYYLLRTRKRDYSDDGRVSHENNDTLDKDVQS